MKWQVNLSNPKYLERFKKSFHKLTDFPLQASSYLNSFGQAPFYILLDSNYHGMMFTSIGEDEWIGTPFRMDQIHNETGYKFVKLDRFEKPHYQFIEQDWE